MEPVHQDNPQRLVLCLVADEQALECFPTAIRYLLVGLIDEAIYPILVAPEDSPADSLAAGPTTVVHYRQATWSLGGHWWHRRLVADVRRKIESFPRETPVIVHSLTPAMVGLSADIAAATDADLVVGLAAESDVNRPELVALQGRVAQLITPSQRILRAVPGSPLAGRPVEIVPLGAVVSASIAAFGGPQLTPALIFAGELTSHGGAELLIRATKRVLQDHPNLLVFVIGKGPAENSLRRTVESLDMQASVTLTGRLEHWRTVLEAADIFCLPGAGSTLREEPVQALAAGLAIVATEDSPYDGFLDGQTALLFPQDDEAALAERICRLLQDLDLARKLAGAAQAHARANHSIAQMVADHVRVYRNLETRTKTFRLAGSRSG